MASSSHQPGVVLLEPQSVPAPRPIPAQGVAVAVAAGDGIGPEITAAVLRILRAAGAAIEVIPVTLGKAAYDAGHTAGISPEGFEIVRRAGVLLKGPITTPQGGGFKSVNVTLRKSLGLFANVRPVRSYHPFVDTLHPGIDLVIIRENEEDLYAGIEHQQTDDVVQCLKLITRRGCERIVRYAFEYAVRNGRKKVSCFTKDNIMKLTDGLFHRVFNEIGRDYPQIEQDHFIIDIGAARLASKPQRFDVIVSPNLYGDILSDIAAEVAGSVGLAPSANIGPKLAMFEAIHGSAPDIAGQGIANPSGMLLAAVDMLVHLGQGETASRIHNAWLATIEAGVHTRDMARDVLRAVKTVEFADEVIARLGTSPRRLAPVAYPSAQEPIRVEVAEPRRAQKTLVGIDIFFHFLGTPDDLARSLDSIESAQTGLRLQMITNRGVKVWPAGLPETSCSDHWRCRFVAARGTSLTHAQIVELLGLLQTAGYDFIKTEHLYAFDGIAGYSLGQGQ